MVHLRRANSHEGSKILDLVKSVLSDYGLEINPEETDRDLSDLDYYYFNKNGWFAVIEEENEIIGSYGIIRIDEKTCELRKMYLLQKFQGQWLGRLMMMDALEKAKELGYSMMVLETNKILDKALSMYQKFGFMQYIPPHLSQRCNIAMRLKL